MVTAVTQVNDTNKPAQGSMEPYGYIHMTIREILFELSELQPALPDDPLVNFPPQLRIFRWTN